LPWDTSEIAEKGDYLLIVHLKIFAVWTAPATFVMPTMSAAKRRNLFLARYIGDAVRKQQISRAINLRFGDEQWFGGRFNG